MKKALHILKIVLKDTVMSREKEYVNEAIKELEELQNRTCKNCKYATLDSARYLPVHKCLVGCNGVDYEFYCNKWEAAK